MIGHQTGMPARAENRLYFCLVLRKQDFNVGYLFHTAVDNFVDKPQNNHHDKPRNAWKGDAERHLY